MTLRISNDQFATLRRQGEEKFIARAAAFLREAYPATAGRAEPAKLDAAIRYGIARANGYGFATERDIVGFLVAMLEIGPKFDEDPRHAALHVPLRGMPGTPASVRMGFLMNAVNEIVAARRNHAA
jgi:hypothetical protein